MGRFALPTGWLLGIIAVILAGLRTDPYLEHVRQIPPPHPYPTFTVLWIVGFITIHTGLAMAVLRPRSYRHSWGRAIIALAISLGFLAFAILGAMHAPPPHAVYLLWLLAFCVIMLGLLVWSIVGAATSSAGT
jgi:uncharacterized membrane protein